MKSVKNIAAAAIAMAALVAGTASAGYTDKWCSDNISGLKAAKETCDDTKKVMNTSVLLTLCTLANEELVDALGDCEGNTAKGSKPVTGTKGGKK
jgi:hypothetical protein